MSGKAAPAEPAPDSAARAPALRPPLSHASVVIGGDRATSQLLPTLLTLGPDLPGTGNPSPAPTAPASLQLTGRDVAARTPLTLGALSKRNTTSVRNRGAGGGAASRAFIFLPFRPPGRTPSHTALPVAAAPLGGRCVADAGRTVRILLMTEPESEGQGSEVGRVKAVLTKATSQLTLVAWSSGLAASC